MAAIAKKLAEARNAAGLTQQQLADLLGITQPTVADIESGRRPLSRKHYGRLPPSIRDRVIDISIDELREQIAELMAARSGAAAPEALSKEWRERLSDDDWLALLRKTSHLPQREGPPIPDEALRRENLY